MQIAVPCLTGWCKKHIAWLEAFAEAVVCLAKNRFPVKGTWLQQLGAAKLREYRDPLPDVLPTRATGSGQGQQSGKRLGYDAHYAWWSQVGCDTLALRKRRLTETCFQQVGLACHTNYALPFPSNATDKGQSMV